jgi:predicted PurR-regulated permease PerM
LIEPLVDWLQKKRIPRSLGLILIYVGIIFIVLFLFRMIIPPISEQIGQLISNFPDLWNKFSDNFAELKELSSKYGFGNNLSGGFGSLEAGIGKAASGVYAFVVSFFKDIINLIFVLVLAFYIVLQKEVVYKVFRAVVPIKYLPRYVKVYEEIQAKIGDWARAQLLLGLIIGALAFAGLIFLIPEYALILAVIAGLTEMIPYLGPTLGAIPAVFLGFLVPETSFIRGFAVLILYVVIQQAENYILVPQIMKKQVGLNPVIVMIAMLIGARIFGIIGIILAIPVATAISIILEEARSKPAAQE